jgi:TRAP-type C4-dicarboxylate transport system permease large subunit
MALMLVIVPIVLLVLTKVVGFDPILLGVVIAINIETGKTTPPVGQILFIIQGIGHRYRITFGEVICGAVPYLLAEAVVLALVIMFPGIALWIPKHIC